MEHVYFVAIESGSGFEKRERRREFLIRFDRLLLRASIKNTLISRKVQSESEKTSPHPTTSTYVRSAVGKSPPVKEKEVQIEVKAHVPPTGMSPVLLDLVSVEYLSARPLLGRLLEAKL